LKQKLGSGTLNHTQISLRVGCIQFPLQLVSS